MCVKIKFKIRLANQCNWSLSFLSLCSISFVSRNSTPVAHGKAWLQRIQNEKPHMFSQQTGCLVRGLMSELYYSVGNCAIADGLRIIFHSVLETWYYNFDLPWRKCLQLWQLIWEVECLMVVHINENLIPSYCEMHCLNMNLLLCFC